MVKLPERKLLDNFVLERVIVPKGSDPKSNSSMRKSILGGKSMNGGYNRTFSTRTQKNSIEQAHLSPFLKLSDTENFVGQEDSDDDDI